MSVSKGSVDGWEAKGDGIGGSKVCMGDGKHVWVGVCMGDGKHIWVVVDKRM